MCSIAKRRMSDAIEGGSSKYPKLMFPVIRLESESDMSDASGSESEYSFQMLDTASARDTSDTSSKSEESEYSLATMSEGEVPEISSGPDDVVVVGDFNELVSEFGSEISVVADLSDDALSTSGDSEIGRADYWKCLKCGTTNKNPCFRLCIRCFRENKRFLPPRPKSRRNRSRNTIKSSGSAGEGPSSLESQDSGLGSSLSQSPEEDASERSDSSEPKCGCCMERPMDGIFLHGDIAHQSFCYKCSLRVWMDRKKCPCCNQLVSKVVKLFRVDVIGEHRG